MITRNALFVITVITTLLVILSNWWGVRAGGEFTGREYMPDMAHSIAYEANVEDYYRLNTWGTREEYDAFAAPRKPVANTIPFGGSGTVVPSIPKNGYVPYYYGNTEEERTRASNEITSNPFAATAGGIAVGKELYNVYCSVCHGEKADGNGHIVREEAMNVYPAQPASLIDEKFIAASDGQFYHALMHGKNVMGSYKDKLSYEERWQVIHYIRSLQAKEQGVEYKLASTTTDETDMSGNSLSTTN